jgi:hypothetical protein
MVIYQRLIRFRLKYIEMNSNNANNGDPEILKKGTNNFQKGVLLTSKLENREKINFDRISMVKI